MALEFIQTDQGPQKVQYDENKLTEAEKIEVQEGKDEGIITSQESEFGNTQGTIPQEVVNEKEVIKTIPTIVEDFESYLKELDKR